MTDDSLNDSHKSSNPFQYLYKFRSLENFEFLLDILLHERLYCSLYQNLNDPFEGTFVSIVKKLKGMKPGPLIPPHVRVVHTKEYKTIENLPIDYSKNRICSLSSDYKDVRLWSHYADGHKGVAIKIDFNGLNESLHKVEYSDQLLTTIQKGKNIKEILPSDILTAKTKHWIYESEFRIIYNQEYYTINNKIKGILLGQRIQEYRKDLLLKIVENSIPIYTTRLNHERIEIEIGQQIN